MAKYRYTSSRRRDQFGSSGAQSDSSCSRPTAAARLLVRHHHSDPSATEEDYYTTATSRTALVDATNRQPYAFAGAYRMAADSTLSTKPNGTSLTTDMLHGDDDSENGCDGDEEDDTATENGALIRARKYQPLTASTILKEAMVITPVMASAKVRKRCASVSGTPKTTSADTEWLQWLNANGLNLLFPTAAERNKVVSALKRFSEEITPQLMAVKRNSEQWQEDCEVAQNENERLSKMVEVAQSNWQKMVSLKEDVEMQLEEKQSEIERMNLVIESMRQKERWAAAAAESGIAKQRSLSEELSAAKHRRGVEVVDASTDEKSASVGVLDGSEHVNDALNELTTAVTQVFKTVSTGFKQQSTNLKNEAHCITQAIGSGTDEQLKLLKSTLTLDLKQVIGEHLSKFGESMVESISSAISAQNTSGSSVADVYSIPVSTAATTVAGSSGLKRDLDKCVTSLKETMTAVSESQRKESEKQIRELSHLKLEIKSTIKSCLRSHSQTGSGSLALPTGLPTAVDFASQRISGGPKTEYSQLLSIEKNIQTISSKQQRMNQNLEMSLKAFFDSVKEEMEETRRCLKSTATAQLKVHPIVAVASTSKEQSEERHAEMVPMWKAATASGQCSNEAATGSVEPVETPKSPSIFDSTAGMPMISPIFGKRKRAAKMGGNDVDAGDRVRKTLKLDKHSRKGVSSKDASTRKQRVELVSRVMCSVMLSWTNKQTARLTRHVSTKIFDSWIKVMKLMLNPTVLLDKKKVKQTLFEEYKMLRSGIQSSVFKHAQASIKEAAASELPKASDCDAVVSRAFAAVKLPKDTIGSHELEYVRSHIHNLKWDAVWLFGLVIVALTAIFCAILSFLCSALFPSTEPPLFV